MLNAASIEIHRGAVALNAPLESRNREKNPISRSLYRLKKETDEQRPGILLLPAEINLFTFKTP